MQKLSWSNNSNQDLFLTFRDVVFVNDSPGDGGEQNGVDDLKEVHRHAAHCVVCISRV
jgi:hypothetical protein